MCKLIIGFVLCNNYVNLSKLFSYVNTSLMTIHNNVARLCFFVRHINVDLGKGLSYIENKMLLLHVLSVLVLCNRLSHSYMPFNRPCYWITCNGYEWRNDWSPTSIPQGRCIQQKRSVHYSHTTHKGNFVCPPSNPCFPQTQQRTTCKYDPLYLNYITVKFRGGSVAYWSTRRIRESGSRQLVKPNRVKPTENVCSTYILPNVRNQI